MKHFGADCLALFLYSVLLLTVTGICGCTSTASVRQSTPVVRSVEDPELEILRDAMAAFKNKDYNAALAGFETLIGQTPNSLIRRKALYGLACCKLAQAENRNDVAAALPAWNRWEKLRPRDTREEDPSMLSPFLRQVSLWPTPATPVYIRHDAAAHKLENCRDTLDKRQNEVQQLKSQLQSKQRETADLRARIKKLKEQINSLEVIYREIQQKKKEVSSQ